MAQDCCEPGYVVAAIKAEPEKLLYAIAPYTETGIAEPDYPNMNAAGSYMLQIGCNTEQGKLEINNNFYIDFGKEPKDPARAHEIRYSSGNCTSDIWL